MVAATAFSSAAKASSRAARAPVRAFVPAAHREALERKERRANHLSNVINGTVGRGGRKRGSWWSAQGVAWLLGALAALAGVKTLLTAVS